MDYDDLYPWIDLYPCSKKWKRYITCIETGNLNGLKKELQKNA
jgi:hypothetical protein